jgi:hypothetical protein
VTTLQWLLSVHSATALAEAAASSAVDAASCESAAVLLQQLAALASLSAADRTALLAAALQLRFALVWRQQQQHDSSPDSSDVLRLLELAAKATTTSNALQTDAESAARTVSTCTHFHASLRVSSRCLNLVAHLINTSQQRCC